MDDYKNGNTEKKYTKKNENLNNKTDLKSTIVSTKKTSITKNKTLNNINIQNTFKNNIKFKKIQYNEWDYKIKEYKKNWCNIFIKKTSKQSIENKKYITNIKKKYKWEIHYIENKIKNLMNEKVWMKKQKYGEDIDFDSLIDNYKNVKYKNYDKIYKNKIKKKQHIGMLITFDSSLSTDSFQRKKHIIETIKEIIIILTYSLKNYIEEYLISTFNSNTRHECLYTILKKFNENIENINIKNIEPKGYTRIGPAIRHSIHEITKLKNKKKNNTNNNRWNSN